MRERALAKAEAAMETPGPPLTSVLPVALDALLVLLLWALPGVRPILRLDNLRDDDEEEDEEEEAASDSGVASTIPSRSLTKSRHSHNITQRSPKSICFTWADTTSTSPFTDPPAYLNGSCQEQKGDKVD